MAQNRHWEQDKDATVYIGNIDERATSTMVYEIMLQMGPIHNIHMPRDRVTQTHQGFGFVEFRTPGDAEYAANVMNGVKLYGKSLRVNKASADKQKQAEVGAELFVGNLDPMVDEKILYDTFSRFGPLLTLPKVAREDSGNSKGFGFISFADFESSDAAVENLHGQYLLSKEVSVQYAFKKDGKGERHGDAAERELAAQAKKRNIVPEMQPVPAAFLNQPAERELAAQAKKRNIVPEMQPVPAAFLNQPQPPPAVAPGAPPVPAGFDPANGLPMHHQHQQHQHQQQQHPQMAQPGMPPGFAPPPRGLPAYNAVPPPHGVPGVPGGGPGQPFGRGNAGYTNPADFHPGSAPGNFRPAPGGPPPPPGFGTVPPPHGFPAPSGTPPAPPG
ncbi:Splicing factor 3B subunit 4 like protein [Verticillium longisporum]|uniref:Splicing factor 3B subunit 4 like protein n=1 Tax=Verticillium longisporum TaxID=100787 RepID=A0A8I3AKB2_VERLO|nr:Splicing factor 3B subunit 4 like protein [Verticillium longisporum]